jgi:Rps23 Pro-64 3,4-dihydroxylase Tpa1-like proline 4-hydroxylase
MTSQSDTTAVNAEEPEEPPPTFSTPYLILDDFLPRADAVAMRRQINGHFAEPHRHTAERHQVWNYWHVPGLYTYMRTRPEKLIERALVERFVQSLTIWAQYMLGLGHVTWPCLSLYVDGCEQKLHNDSANGRFGFVYSLTWDERKTQGGETIVMKEGDLFRDNMGRANAGQGLLDLIEPKFNRLTLFDDRMVHGVQRVEGSMNPVEGRLVLHGHISESGPMADGPLDAAAVARALHDGLGPLLSDVQRMPVLHHGPLVLRLTIEPSGEVSRVDRLVDRVARADGNSAGVVVGQVVSLARSLRFPEAPAATEATIPLLFGGNLPWMRPKG